MTRQTLIAVLICIVASTGFGGIITVPDDYPEIQQAIDASTDGDTVLIRPGTWFEHDIDFSGKPITVTSLNPENQGIVETTIVDGGGLGSVFYFHSSEDTTSILAGLTITRGNAEKGGGINCDQSSPMIFGCIIRENSAENGGAGICSSASSNPVIRGCFVTRNGTTGYGGGIRCYGTSSPLIDRTSISQNRARSGGGIYLSIQSTVQLVNCTVSGNRAFEYGGGISGSPRIVHCTFAGNTAAVEGGGISASYPGCSIINSILWGDSPEEIAGNPVISYSDVQGGWPGEGNFDLAPLFIGGEDYHLLRISPCVDTGADIGILRDIDGELRPMQAGFDVGSDEYAPEGAWINVTPSSFEFIRRIGEGLEADTLLIESNGREPLQYAVIPGSATWLILEGDTTGVLDPGESTQLVLTCDITGLTPGYYDDILVVESNDPLFSEIVVPVELRLFSQNVIYVPGDFDNIQDAIDFADDGDTILVDSGTYTGEGNRNIDFLGKPLTVMSMNGPDSTIIDCEGAGRGFHFQNEENEDSILDGFTIVDGYTPGDGAGILCEESASPSITGCIFTGNNAGDNGGATACHTYCFAAISDCIFTGNNAGDDGGAIYCNHGSPVIENCSITGNSSDEGGGIACYSKSTPTILNCTIENNSSYDGGGISCDYNSSPVIADCSVSDNYSSDDGGGIYCEDISSPSITNCIISGNEADDDGAGICCYSGNPEIENCVITGNTGYSLGGGAYHKSGSPVYRACFISENTTDYGGGLYFRDCTAIVENCILTGNSVSDYGGGIRCISYATATIINCTITGNSAGDGGGVAADGSSPIINNTILRNNSPDEIYVDGGSPDVTYSDIEGGWTGEGNIDADPFFASYMGFEYLLNSPSPCIDTGDPEIEDRLNDSHPLCPGWYENSARSDMGAYGGPGNILWLNSL